MIIEKPYTYKKTGKYVIDTFGLSDVLKGTFHVAFKSHDKIVDNVYHVRDITYFSVVYYPVLLKISERKKRIEKLKNFNSFSRTEKEKIYVERSTEQATGKRLNLFEQDKYILSKMRKEHKFYSGLANETVSALNLASENSKYYKHLEKMLRKYESNINYLENAINNYSFRFGRLKTDCSVFRHADYYKNYRYSNSEFYSYLTSMNNYNIIDG